MYHHDSLYVSEKDMSTIETHGGRGPSIRKIASSYTTHHHHACLRPSVRHEERTALRAALLMLQSGKHEPVHNSMCQQKTAKAKDDAHPQPTTIVPTTLRAITCTVIWYGITYYTFTNIDALQALVPDSARMAFRDFALERRSARFVAYCMAAYFGVAIVAVRAAINGPLATAIDLLWLCNLGLFLGMAGLMTGNALMVSVALIAVLPDQALWYIDVLCYGTTGKFHVGVAKYIVNPAVPFNKKITSVHHLLFLPIMVWALRTNFCPTFAVWVVSAAFVMITAYFCRAVTPMRLAAGSKHDVHYCNTNLCYEMWPDVKIPLFHALDAPYLHVTNPNVMLYALWIGFIYNVIVGLPFFALIVRPILLHGRSGHF